jgi:uncharacterized membrane protein (DUF4010 family)
MENPLWQQVGIALGLGLLVGLQRERTQRHGAGIRTFPLITVLGTLCTHLARSLGGWTVFGGLIVVGAMMVVVNIRREEEEDPHPGPTTEIAALVMYTVGALLALGQVAPAIAVGGGVAVLLHWKKPLHGFVERIGDAEIRAVFRLTLIALVILPILPDRSFGPYDVLNPFRIWLMVVLIVGISLASYLASRFLGARTGSVLAGVMGGLISSTATTVSYARRSRQAPDTSALAATVIMTASTIVFLRVAFEVSVVAPLMLPHVLPQLGVMAGWMALISVGAFLVLRGDNGKAPAAEDPSDLRAAVVFGLLYAAVLVAVAAAKEHFGDRGLYVVAALSGLTDMDAITLSTAQMMQAERVALDTGWRMMLVGALSNIVFKAVVIGIVGYRRLFRYIAILFVLSLIGGALLLWLWPNLGS